MLTAWRETIWRQFGAAVDTLENAMRACPDELWADRSKKPEFWHVAYHTLFWLDYYLSESFDNFTPPAPFGLEELDPAGAVPERPYTRKELCTYLEYGRSKSRARVATLTDAEAARPFKFGSVDLTAAELLLYVMRHLQHHAAQLHLILRQQTDSAPRWVIRSGTDLVGK